ncbi:hypothetical protein [Plantactinospora soyae]|uniref:Uncharacterized protein n=1 Tax=Plantactinospora soyae TaxID=1544732 RepID=A0A927M5W4_9ACTN|nr:hypothetical protein [Plantactinospora soyae]MBE1487346.1 hypothetical protein [Plantactinospora soyae]
MTRRFPFSEESGVPTVGREPDGSAHSLWPPRRRRTDSVDPLAPVRHGSGGSGLPGHRVDSPFGHPDDSYDGRGPVRAALSTLDLRLGAMPARRARLLAGHRRVLPTAGLLRGERR